MDRKSTSLFEVVADGDESTLQRLLIEAKEERNIATLAVSLLLVNQIKDKHQSIFNHLLAWKHSSS